MRLGEKLIRERKGKGLTQQALADRCGISKRAIASYETDGRIPHASTLNVIARELGCPRDYLLDDSAEDYRHFSAEEQYIGHMRSAYGDQTANEIEELLSKTAALFAGGTLTQEAKDRYFLALTNAYLACKKEGEKS